MAQIKTKVENKTRDWLPYLKFKVGESCIYNGGVYVNTTGSNSEPGVGNDWIDTAPGLDLNGVSKKGSSTDEEIETNGYRKKGKTDKDLPTLGGNDIAISDVYIKVDSQDTLKSQTNLFDGKTFDFLGKKVRYDENATPDGVDVIAHDTLDGGFVVEHDYLLDARLFGLKEGQDNGYVFEAISTKIQSLGGDCVVVIPSGTYDSTKQIRITSNNVTIQLNGTINYTGDQKIHFIEVGTNGGTQLRNFRLLGQNGATISGYDELQGVTFVQNDAGNCCHVDNTLGVVIKDVAFNNGYVGCLQAARSASVIIDNCTATGSQNNNGISIAFGIANPTNEQYPQSLISNCKAFDCMDFGIASFASINVSFENCYAISCGNYDANQIDAGGGISMEDNAGVTNSITFNNKFKNCHAIDCKNQGFFITGNGVELDEFCTASGTLRDNSVGADPNFFNGNGVFVINAQNVKVRGTYNNNATDGVQILGDVNGLFFTGSVDITSKSNGRHGLFGRGISQLKINGGDYESNTSGGIRFQNNSATYNTGNGEIIGNNISTKFNGDEGSFFTGLKSVKIDNHYVEDEGGNGVRFENTETVRVNSIKAFTSDIGVFSNAVNIIASCTNGYIKDTDVWNLTVVNNAANKEEVVKKSDYNWNGTGKLKVNGNEVYHPGNLPPSITESQITGTERQYTQQQQFAIQQVTDEATLVWNLRGKQVAFLLATSGVGNTRTFFNTSLVNTINGGYSKLYYVQDATGGRNLVFDNKFVVSGEIDTRANKVTIIHLNISRDGSKYFVKLEPVEPIVTENLDTRASNLADDLNETEKNSIKEKIGLIDAGDFTPTLTVTGGATITSTLSYATYSKIGNVCAFTIKFTNIDTSAIITDEVFTVASLPFSTAQNTLADYFITDASGGNGSLKCEVMANEIQLDYVNFAYDGDGTSASELMISGSFIVDETP